MVIHLKPRTNVMRDVISRGKPGNFQVRYLQVTDSRSFHTVSSVLSPLISHVVATVPSRVFAQVVLVIVLRAVPGGGGLNGCRDRTLPLP